MFEFITIINQTQKEIIFEKKFKYAKIIKNLMLFLNYYQTIS